MSSPAAYSHFVTGGARAGKSRFVLAEAERTCPGGPIAFIATARASDADMALRIARHREERGPAYRTFEEPEALEGVLRREAPIHRGVIVDCLTVWTANIMFPRNGPSPSLEALYARFDALAELVAAAPCPVWLVSNEVGLSIHPEHEVSRRYVDVLGRLNQRMARASTRATLLVAGLPLPLKG